MEVIAKLRERDGNVFVRSALELFGLLLLLSILLSVYHVHHVLGAVREKVNESVLAVAAVNVPEFYGGARESDGFARHPYEGGFVFSINSEDVLDTLSRSVGATSVDDDAGAFEVGDAFAVRGLTTRFVNQSGSILNFTTSLTVAVPLELGGFSVPIEVRMQVRSSYDPRF